MSQRLRSLGPTVKNRRWSSRSSPHLRIGVARLGHRGDRDGRLPIPASGTSPPRTPVLIRGRLAEVLREPGLTIHSGRRPAASV